MSDRPIIFSASMIRALLDGRKSQTRRILKPQPKMLNGGFPLNNGRGSYSTDAGWTRYSYAVGDRLWVREQCATWVGTIRDVVYRADETAGEWDNIRHDAALGHWKLRSSIHMPRWASRLTLTVADVRVQRVQDISGEDCLAEGACEAAFLPLTDQDTEEARDSFRALWNSIHGPEAWALNPWVAALTFTVHRCNIDQMPGGNHE